MSVEKVEVRKVKIPAGLVSLVEEFIEEHGEHGYETVEEFIAEAVRRRLFTLKGTKQPEERRVDGEVRGTQLKERYKIEVSKELYDILVGYCEWSGEDIEKFVERELLLDLEAALDYAREYPRGAGLFKKVTELKEKRSNYFVIKIL